MADLSNLVQKALYLGIGLASYANEKARMTLQELKEQAQKVADEMVARGEMTAEEARKYVDELVQQAQQTPDNASPSSADEGPRKIEIIEEDETTTSKPENVDGLRQQVESLQEELRRLKRK
jgi:polyhydroxyalkanoate synthesis regulator phasin